MRNTKIFMSALVVIIVLLVWIRLANWNTTPDIMLNPSPIATNTPTPTPEAVIEPSPTASESAVATSTAKKAVKTATPSATTME